ncbi:hypothetical protein HWV62_10885 [Athelia sp. TMB]|nr:hypothetical protein HWV62_10885 [Athelia sp. TMB]
MPLRGSGHSKSVGDEAPYFETLADLDAWAATPSKKLGGVLDFQQSQSRDQTESERYQGKLLVCHDYKGGYTESPSALAYTFNFWSHCDTFVYFSHHRVTVPPSGWINAAHRQGVKMLGTLIFEGSGEDDCLRLLVGQLPTSTSGPALPSTTTLPLSPHYARVLADLAAQRGFDGYLLNFECPLRGGVEQTRALSAWIPILQAEMLAKVGPHAQALWYDSVIINGQLRWQDRLNSLNLPFFLSSTGFFTNYTWAPHYPSLTASYFLSLNPALTQIDHSIIQPKSLRDIFIGVDVWGRGSHGGGGFGCYKAISHVDPKGIGLSVALFGQAWSWESEQDKPGWTWETWWDYERKLWLGPANKGHDVFVPEAPRRQGEPECPHGKFKPLVSFFTPKPPPNPAVLAFYTSFCIGVGRRWFVEGEKVLQTESGWTDVDKQTSLGDLLWPRPALVWEGGDRAEALPEASVALDLDVAWNGGSSLRMEVSGQGSDEEDAFFRCIWLPIQSLSITTRRSYEAHVIYKLSSSTQLDFDTGLSVKIINDTTELPVEFIPISVTPSDLAGGWIKLAIQFEISADQPQDITCALGLILGYATEDATMPYTFSLLLGQITVFPAYPRNAALHQPKILWAAFKPTPEKVQSGVLTWEVASAFPPVADINITTPEDPRPAWNIDTSIQSLPAILYYNIYVQLPAASDHFPHPDQSLFIGTTGLDGRERRFFVDPKCLPDAVSRARKVRFLVQGVTTYGEVLKWEQCVFVDVNV